MDKKIILFFLVGALNSLVGYSLFVFFLWTNFSYQISIAFATILGILFNFKTTGKIVFNNASKSKFMNFFCVYLFIYILNIVLIKYLLLFNFNVYIANAILIIPLALINFFLQKLLVFK